MGAHSAAVRCIESMLHLSPSRLTAHIFTDIQGREPILFMLDAKSSNCDTRNGSHRRCDDAHLATASQNSKYSPAIRAVLKLGKAHLNKYYNMTDHSEVYRIAMSEFIFWITLFNYNYLEQSYIHNTNFNISTRPTGTTRGLPPQTQLSVMSLCEHTQTSLTRLLFAWGMYVFPSNFFLCWNSPICVF
jgi:hypothetical protein